MDERAEKINCMTVQPSNFKFFYGWCL